ncbi:MAG TPA: serine hydrolase domain-containing protein, partial [Chthonomonadaceae bacterium]|nr:serine hydrolase domain-containing protein [Chthonomonadaceae bacterium]
MTEETMKPTPLFLAMSLILLCWTLAAHADRVDDVVKAQMQKRHIPGLSVAVVRDGKPVLMRGYGLADVERNVRASPDTVYELGSITKQFTAMAILMLVEEGKLGLDDKIRAFLSDLPAAWSEVTVRNLLTHTSGIKNYTDIPDITKRWRNDYTHEEIIKLVSGDPLEFAPGEKWAYSNTGYFLLGMILEKVSGKPYGAFLEERIFKPLGMTSTQVNDLGAIIPNRACGYTLADNSLRNADYASMTWPFAAGVLVSTVRDMAKWDAALTTGRLLKPASYRQMWTPVTLKDGKKAEYGFGWAISDYQGHKFISHNGGIPGFVTTIDRFVDDKLTVIVLTNSDVANPDTIAKEVAGVYVPALTPIAPKPIADKDAQTTAHLRQTLEALAEDKADPAAFTPEAQKALFPDRAKQAAGFLKTLGPLKSFTLLEEKAEADHHHY